MVPLQIVITLCRSNNRTTKVFGLRVKVAKHGINTYQLLHAHKLNIHENHKTYAFRTSFQVKETFTWNSKNSLLVVTGLHEDAKL